MGIDDDNGAGTPAGPDDRPMTPLETAKALSFAKLRIAELEAALRDLIAKIDPIYDLESEDRPAYDRAKSILERS